MKALRLAFLSALLVSCGGNSGSFVSSNAVSSIEASSQAVSSQLQSSSIEATTQSSEIASSEEAESIASSVEALSSSEDPSIESSEEPSYSEEESSEEEFSSVEAESSVFEDSSEEIFSDSSSSEESSVLPIDPSTLYEGYYASLIDWVNGEDLRQKLHDIISGGTYVAIPYSDSVPNWASNTDADQSLYDHETLDVVYSEDDVIKTATGNKWQREHAFPATLMTGSLTANAARHLGRATDFHNLFASSQNGNSSRGNKNFGVADKTAEGYVDRTSANGKDGYSFDRVTFEPARKDKGRLSRAIFYMATMYSEPDYDEKNDVLMQPLTIVEENIPYLAADHCLFSIGHLSELLAWAELPVDLLEYQHNDSVYRYAPAIHSDPSKDVAQGNRNPYVDFPGLVSYAFGEKKDEPGSLADLYSSYETLKIGEEGVSHYAVDHAKRTYERDEAFSRSDVSVVEVARDFSEKPYADFAVYGATDAQAFAKPGDNLVLIATPKNDILYNVNVLEDRDPIDSATWQHAVTAKSSGNDFYGIADSHDTHTLDFDGVDFDVKFNSGSVQSNSSSLGCKFGKKGEPVGQLSFYTHSAFAYGGATKVKAIYIRGAVASNTWCNVTFYLNGNSLGSKRLDYPGQGEVADIGVTLPTSTEGVVGIVFTSVTDALYLKNLAIHAE